MPQTLKVITNFKNTIDSALAVLSATVVEQLTGNTGFVFPDELTKLAEKLAAFLDALEKTHTNDSVAVAKKNQLRLELLELLSVIATLVNMQAKGNEAMLKSSGFPLIDTDKAVEKVKPTKVVVERTKVPKQVKVKVGAEKGAIHGMAVAITKAKDAPANVEDWKIYVSTKLTFLFEDLELKEDYLICVAYIYANTTKLIFSEPIKITVV